MVEQMTNLSGQLMLEQAAEITRVSTKTPYEGYAMNQILTDEEKSELINTAHCRYDLVENVIAAYEAKLWEHDPVAFYDGNKFYANEESAICGCADMAKLKPVFTHPAPIPEGWKELMIRTISRMRAAHVPCADIERSAEAMLAAARSG